VPEIRPFRGLLYEPRVAGRLETLTAGPYDNISPAEQERLYRANPFNVVRLILGKDQPDDDASTNKYTRAAAFLGRWHGQGILVQTLDPAVYPYELRFHLGGTRRTVRGLIAEVGLESWGGAIIPHEQTLPGPIDDRLRLLRAVAANLSPVYTVFAKRSNEMAEFLGRAMLEPPAREVTDESGTRHRLWTTSRGVEGVAEALRDRTLMIADGHHRYAVALAYREEMRAREGPGPWDSMMMLIVDGVTEDPPVLPIHRVVSAPIEVVSAATDRHSRASRPRADATLEDGERVRDLAEILATLRDENLTYGTVRMEDGEVVHRVATLTGHPPTVSVLHAQVLDHLHGLEMRFLPDAVAAEQAVLSEAASTAFLLPPTKVDRVWRLVDDGRKLPQKSTYFWPKPRTGLVIRPMALAPS
jgi:uncharacterized protein (DUF1015 family)